MRHQPIYSYFQLVLTSEAIYPDGFPLACFQGLVKLIGSVGYLSLVEALFNSRHRTPHGIYPFHYF